jgi:hypothetical protein
VDTQRFLKAAVREKIRQWLSLERRSLTGVLGALQLSHDRDSHDVNKKIDKWCFPPARAELILTR